MSISYELAKELEQAGFPQDPLPNCFPEGWFEEEHSFVGNMHIGVSDPTLSELIEACGDELKCVRNFLREMWAAHGRIEGTRHFRETWPDSPEWIAEAVSNYIGDEGTTGAISASGKTPEESVARLWLALNNKEA